MLIRCQYSGRYHCGYQVRHKLYTCSQVRDASYWFHFSFEVNVWSSPTGSLNKQHLFICMYRYWVPQGLLAKADTQQLVYDGKVEQNTWCNESNALNLSGTEVAFTEVSGWGRLPKTMRNGGTISIRRGPALLLWAATSQLQSVALRHHGPAKSDPYIFIY